MSLAMNQQIAAETLREKFSDNYPDPVRISIYIEPAIPEAINEPVMVSQGRVSNEIELMDLLGKTYDLIINPKTYGEKL